MGISVVIPVYRSEDTLDELIDRLGKVLPGMAQEFEVVLVNDEVKQKYLTQARTVRKLYKAILPDPSSSEFVNRQALLAVIANKILSLNPEADISGVMESVEELLDESITSQGYVIDKPASQSRLMHS